MKKKNLTMAALSRPAVIFVFIILAIWQRYLVYNSNKKRRNDRLIGGDGIFLFFV